MKCKCGNEDKFIVIIYPTRKELRCAECGKYIKFINTDDYWKLKASGKIKFEEKK